MDLSLQSLVPACWFLPWDAALMSESAVSQCQVLSILAHSSLFEATNDPKFVAESSRLGCTQDEPSCSEELDFISTGSRDVSANVPSHHRVHLCLSLPAGYLLGSVTEKDSGGTRVTWGRFSVSHQVGVSGVHQTDTGSNLVPAWGL